MGNLNLRVWIQPKNKYKTDVYDITIYTRTVIWPDDKNIKYEKKAKGNILVSYIETTERNYLKENNTAEGQKTWKILA